MKNPVRGLRRLTTSLILSLAMAGLSVPSAFADGFSIAKLFFENSDEADLGRALEFLARSRKSKSRTVQLEPTVGALHGDAAVGIKLSTDAVGNSWKNSTVGTIEVIGSQTYLRLATTGDLVAVNVAGKIYTHGGDESALTGTGLLQLRFIPVSWDARYFRNRDTGEKIAGHLIVSSEVVAKISELLFLEAEGGPTDSTAILATFNLRGGLAGASIQDADGNAVPVFGATFGVELDAMGGTLIDSLHARGGLKFLVDLGNSTKFSQGHSLYADLAYEKARAKGGKKYIGIRGDSSVYNVNAENGAPELGSGRAYYLGAIGGFNF